MPAAKRPSTSSLRRFISSRPYVTVSEVRRRFGLEESDAVSRLRCDGATAWIGLPEREASKICELWQRGEIGLELSHEVRAPAVVGIYPMRLAWHVMNASNAQRVDNSVSEASPARVDQASLRRDEATERNLTAPRWGARRESLSRGS
jgi:hypothetical protein